MSNMFPGTWSKTIYEHDLIEFPPNKESEYCDSYLEYFRKTRGQERPIKNPKVWRIFSKGSIMLYFENEFLRMIDSMDDLDEYLLLYFEVMSESSISAWETIVNACGAKNVEDFINNPRQYISNIRHNIK